MNIGRKTRPAWGHGMVHFFNGPISDEPTKYRGNKTIYFQFDFRIVPTVIGRKTRDPKI
jgi:hypothetical protein